jgi:hypothetical protein
VTRAAHHSDQRTQEFVMVVSQLLRHVFSPAILCALLAACGGEGGPPDDDQNPPPGGGTPAGDAVTQQIGPAGGTIATADGGISLVIPAGALAAATDITIRPMVNTAPTGIGPAYRLEPNPLPVSAPVELRIAVDAAALGNSPPEAVGIGVRNSGGDWFGNISTSGEPAAAVSSARGLQAFQDGRVVSVTRVEGPDEWIEYSLIAFWVVRPFQPIIVSRGESVRLAVEACLREDETASSDPEFLPMLPGTRSGECQPSIREGTWFVNGVQGGNQSLGFVAAGNPTSTAEFVAPSSVPSPNPVTVTASLYWRARNVTAPPFQIPIAVRSGNLAGTASGTLSSGLVEVGDLFGFDASVTWAPEPGQGDGGGIINYQPTGTISVRAINRCISALQPETFPIEPTMGTLTINWEDGTWTGSGIALPPGGSFRYFDTCANMEAALEASMVPFLTNDGSRPLPVQGALAFPQGAGLGLRGTFSFQ